MASCFYHEDRDAVARCAVCGKGICEECAIMSGGMAFCSDECKSKAASSCERSDDVIARKAKSDSAALVRKLIYIFVLILAIAAAYFFYGQNKKTIDSKVNKSVKQIKKGSSGLIKDTKAAIPTSSQIKRQKENLVK